VHAVASALGNYYHLPRAGRGEVILGYRFDRWALALVILTATYLAVLILLVSVVTHRDRQFFVNSDLIFFLAGGALLTALPIPCPWWIILITFASFTGSAILKKLQTRCSQPEYGYLTSR